LKWCQTGRILLHTVGTGFSITIAKQLGSSQHVQSHRSSASSHLFQWGTAAAINNEVLLCQVLGGKMRTAYLRRNIPRLRQACERRPEIPGFVVLGSNSIATIRPRPRTSLICGYLRAVTKQKPTIGISRFHVWFFTKCGHNDG
jgi:hypothetical protein